MAPTRLALKVAWQVVDTSLLLVTCDSANDTGLFYSIILALVTYWETTLLLPLQRAHGKAKRVLPNTAEVVRDKNRAPGYAEDEPCAIFYVYYNCATPH